MKKSLLLKSAIALALASPLLASAESDVNFGAAPSSASARLDFRVVIPNALYLQVGSAGTAIDTVEFDLAAVTPGAGGSVAATAPVPVRVIGNVGNVNLTATTAGALSNGAGSSISFAKISAATSNGSLPHPTLVDGGASSATSLAATAGVVNLSANWTFSYLNDTVVAAGTYGDTVANNSRVTYTVATP